MKHPSLFEPLQLGSFTLPNRSIMAPLTRMRAGIRNAPTALNATYYAQRANAGLIIAEGTAVSEQAQGYPSAPGIYTREQIDGWKAVTTAVHSAGGLIFLQIAHNERNSHSSFMPDGGPPVAPSAIASTSLASHETSNRFLLRCHELSNSLKSMPS
jgi:N-ethylmaleimide reductase